MFKLSLIVEVDHLFTKFYISPERDVGHAMTYKLRHTFSNLSFRSAQGPTADVCQPETAQNEAVNVVTPLNCRG